MSQDTRKSYRRWLLLVGRWLIFALVVAGIVKTVLGAREDFAEAKLRPADLNYALLALAGGLYMVGSAPMGLFWFALLRAMGQRLRLLPTLRAFFIGHLGKYVPGKAMVVILRAGLIAGPGVSGGVAAVSVFVETLTMMAAGAAVAAVVIATSFPHRLDLLLLAVGLAAIAGVPTWMPVFRRIVWILKVRHAAPEVQPAMAGITYPVMGVGWLCNLIGWPLMGLSLWAVLAALPAHLIERTNAANQPPVFLVALAAVSLAMVAGFLSLLPGGVGVREYIVLTLLAPLVGTVAALVSAVLLRICWLAAELVVAGALYPFGSKAVPKTDPLAGPTDGGQSPALPAESLAPRPGADW